jgi:asparaginyl-tRNA synthetase
MLMMFKSIVSFTAYSSGLVTRSRFRSHRLLSSGSACDSNTLLPAVTATPWKIKSLVASAEDAVGTTVKVEGWVRTVREQKMCSFISVTDGSTLKGLQVVADSGPKLSTGCSVQVIGKVVRSPHATEQSIEILADSVHLVGDCAEDYPLQKKAINLDVIRPLAHIRARTNTISSVARVRSRLAQAIHAFFAQRDFTYVQTPLITASDCEGAGEMFRVTTLPLEGPINKLPRTDEGLVDFTEDYFRKPAFLTVSGQLCGEAYASCLGNIYTFGPTFRAENSVGIRHLAEFHMLEPELAFADLSLAMDNAEELVKFVTKEIIISCSEEMEFFNKFIKKGISERISSITRDEPFHRISYRDAIKLLQSEIKKNRNKWKYPNVEFGIDLQTEHERWLAESHFNGCVFVHNYPRKIKPFYMRDNADGETVDSFDLLVPGVCELIGGSQREERLDVLLKKMEENKLDVEEYQWYIDLRRYGTVPHAGYGLGFERLVCFLTGTDNIRDAVAFPRYTGSLKF